ncbi:PAS domain-containing protein [Paenibacillus sp. CC-CFT747]|nr:PAS domain-containing protein [Paenibacillus sp. CC-CFT747]
MIEQLETSNEELQATNEELIASNEELQSTNEELSSVNEELVTVNSEFQSKIHELIEVNSDMNNFLSASNIGTIFLDIDLSVRRFTPNVMDVINLMEVDVGRPIMHISHNLVYDRMVPDIEEVLRTLVPIEREVQSNQKNWYLLKISPYRTVDHYIKGIIMTLVNITELKSINSQLSKLSLAIEQSPSVVMITDKQMKIEYVNPAFTDITGYSREEVIGTEARALERGEGGRRSMTSFGKRWARAASGRESCRAGTRKEEFTGNRPPFFPSSTRRKKWCITLR